MEKLIMEKCHRPLWFVFVVSFLLSFMFLLFDITTSTGGVGDQNRVTFLVNFVNTIQASKPKSSGYSGSSCNETTSSSFVMRNSTNEEVIVSERPVNTTEDKNKQNFAPSRAPAVSNGEPVAEQLKSSLDACSGRYIYMHELPSQFNADLVKNCYSLSKWSDMCSYLSNLGLGPRVKDSKRVLPKQGWFATNQFTLEVIFHNRMKHYKCLTNDSSLASAIYVPFYAGLDVGRYLWGFNISMRDASSLSMVKWLAQKPEWKRMWGRDHFLVGGRIAWDFRRNTDDDSDWGSKLMFLPESKNMTLLSIESSSWNNEFAVPYPTSFHPSKKSQVSRWQKKMRRSNRKYLFSFAGAPRRNSAGSIRTELIDQCQSSYTCNFLDCLDGPNKCDNPANLMKAFQSSVFCLQPPGDSYTRRSTFDSILAGCIPVFFHRGSACGQYLWHLPKNHTKYSVLIPMNDVKEKRVLINKTLAGVPKKDVLAMREEVIKLIPRILYTDPRSRQQSFKDAFDIAVEGILKRIETVRKKIKEGKDPSIGFAELNWPKF